MFKKSIIAISTIAMLGSAVPAMAGAFGDAGHADAADSFLISLQQRGVDAVGVSEWGDYLKATVTLPEGGTQFQYFDPDTFERVTF